MSEHTTTRSAESKITEAQSAALELANLSESARNDALHAIADAIEANADAILDANERDVAEAEELLEAGEYTQAFVDRLTLSASKLESIAGMVRSVAGQEDPLGRTLAARELDEDLELYKVSVPIGVLGAVFESRPDALVQIAALSLKSGNSVVLKGGSEATHSNRILHEIIVEAAADRDDAVDLLMPRGSSSFVSYVEDNTSIPVLGHTEGVCHVYVDSEADLTMAENVAYDAKVQYPAVCNAVETLLVNESVADEFLPAMADRYREAGVELRGDEQVRKIIDAEAATDDDWTTEYGDLILAIKVVDSVDDAIDYINTNGSKHTESIITEDDEAAGRFMRGIDAASVFHNASTRFADGYRFGLGAEVGISTGKTHARGPVGLEGLTTYKYHLEGDGQLVATYAGENPRPFTHTEFDGEWTPGRLSDRDA
jgi:glutamate-5-semialdehyde dehydrogenase